jgi:hypothetical protein
MDKLLAAETSGKTVLVNIVWRLAMPDSLASRNDERLCNSLGVSHRSTIRSN